MTPRYYLRKKNGSIVELTPQQYQQIQKNRLPGQKTIRYRPQPQRRQVPQQIPQPPVQLPPRPINMFQKNEFPTPMESVMDILFGGAGEREMGRQQALFPELQTFSPGYVINDAMNQAFPPQPEPRFRPIPKRFRRVKRG